MKFQTVIRAAFIVVCFHLTGIACNDCGGDPIRFKVTSYTLEEIEGSYNASLGTLLFNPPARTLGTNDSVRYMAAGFSFEPTIEHLSLARPGRLVSNSLACDPAPSSTQMMRNITITSSDPFVSSATTYPAGESLNSLFAVENNQNALPEGDLNLPVPYGRLVLTLKEAPATIQKHQFTFTFRLMMAT